MTGSIDQYLTKGTPDSILVIPIFQDERPLKDSTGLLDWRLYGFISKHIANGRIIGKHNETVLIPVYYHGEYKYILVLGLGIKALNPFEQKNKKEILELSLNLNKTISKLKFKHVYFLNSFLNEKDKKNEEVKEWLTSKLQSLQTGWIQ